MRTLFAALASLAFFCAGSARADDVHDALEAYALYQNDVSALLESDIASAADVDAALARLQRHNTARVSRGWIAYGALTAAQSPAFAAGIERSVRESGRTPLLNQWRDNVYSVRPDTRGSDQAIQLILNAANADGARVEMVGARYDRYARTAAAPRRSAATPAPNRETIRLSPEMRERLRVTPVSSRPMSRIEDFGGRGFWDSMAGRDAPAPGGRARREQAEYASVTDHMLTLAALVVADAADSERRRVSQLLNEPLTQNCMEMQRLQLRQCLSVSVDATERAYCLAQHGLNGPGQCFANVAR
jgi:hypothetical protein